MTKNQIEAPVVKAIIAFVSVNLDELIVLIVFFSRTLDKDSTYTSLQVVTGQLIGFTLIFAVSILGISLDVFFPAKYVALIGIIPLLIGCQQLYKVFRYWYGKYRNSKRDYLNIEEIVTIELQLNESMTILSTENLNYQPQISQQNLAEMEKGGAKCSGTNDSSDDDGNNEKGGLILKTIESIGKHCLHPNILLITVTIVADGAEEIGVFLPLFAATTSTGVVVTVITFYVLILLQCFLAYQIVKCSYIGKYISRYSKNIVPFVLIGLGLYVLSGSILATIIVNGHA